MCSRRCSARARVTVAKGVARRVLAGSCALFCVLDGCEQGGTGLCFKLTAIEHTAATADHA